MYLQYITTLSKTYVQLFGKIEDKRNRLEKVLNKLENISGQVEFNPIILEHFQSFCM